jgi:hypothetical protein
MNEITSLHNELKKSTEHILRPQVLSMLIKNNDKLLSILMQLTKFLDNEKNVSFKRRLWHFQNNCYEKVLCKECGINYANWSESKGYTSCSKKCTENKKKKIFLEKYGVDNPNKSHLIKAKIEETNKKKYGSKTVFGTKHFKDILGVDNPMKSDIIKEKRKLAILQKYGVDHTSRTTEVKNKIKTYLENNKKDIAVKVKKSLKEKYGVDNPMKSDIIKNLIKDKFIKNHKLDGFTLININNGKFEFNCHTCNNDFVIDKTTYYNRIKNNISICPECFPLNNKWSNLENELLKFIEENYDGVIIKNDREVIKPEEIDILLPELKIGIEFNGLYWHSSINKEVNYHKEKELACRKKGIQLIQIWEDDWIYKKEMIKGILLNKFNKSKKIFARKTTLKLINYKEFSKFINENHLQGSIPANLYYGLYSDNYLVCAMSFRKEKEIWEISRLATKIGYSVIGGVSKILKSFEKLAKPKTLISYCCKDYFNGNTYLNVGMKLVKETKPSLFFVNKKFDKRINRRRLQKSDQSEYYKVYNSGNLLFIKEYYS